MTRRAEHGGVPWYLLFTLAAAGATGVGTYVVLHQHEIEKAKQAAIEAAKPKPAKPAPTPTAPGDPLGGVTIETPRTEGELGPTDIELRIGGVREKLQICYAGVDGDGSVELEFVVRSTGRPALFSTKNSFDESVANCVTAVLEQLRFASRTSDTQVTQTIRFAR